MNLDICGLMKIVQTEEEWGITKSTPIPLVSVDVNASVVHTVAQVEVTQVYINREKQAIEAIYYFPVNPEGAVTHFEAELNGKKIKGTIEPCEEVQDDYEEAVEKQNTAFLREETKPEIFKIRVGYLKPGASAKLVIGYVTEVKNEPGTNSIRFYIPTTIAPRYVSPSGTDTKAEEISAMTFTNASSATLSIKVDISLQGKIKSITSPTHKVEVAMTGPISGKPAWEQAIVELATQTNEMDRDFVLKIVPEDIHRPRLYSETLADGSTAMMVYLIPSFKRQEQKIEAIFVLDQSQSMYGKKINLARDGLLIFLHSLPEDCYFNVVGFGSTHKFLFDCSVKYDYNTLKQALAYAQSMDADMGGTEIYETLEELYGKPCVKGYSRQIFFLTDGRVNFLNEQRKISDTEAVLGIVHKNSENSRLFAIGIGKRASHYLVEGMAKAGGGTSAFVTTDEGITKKVLHQLKIGLQPSLRGIKIDWEGRHTPESSNRKKLPENKVKTLLTRICGCTKANEPAETSKTPEADKLQFLNQSPSRFPPIFDECQLLVIGMFKNSIPKYCTITAESPDGPFMVKLEYRNENDVGSIGMLHKLAAIKIVRELEKELRQLEEQDDSDEKDGLKQKIIEMGRQHGIMCFFTSFVVLDKNAGERIENLFVERRQVPSQFRDCLTSVFRKKWGCSVKKFPDQAQFGSILRRIEPRLSLNSSRMFASYGSLASCRLEDGDYIHSSKVALDTSNESVSEANKDSSHELVRFINLQSFDGSFNLDDNFCQVFEKDLDMIQLAAKKNGLQNMELATAIAVATFTTRFASECDVWGFIVEKAKKWLASRLSLDHTEKALKLATLILDELESTEFPLIDEEIQEYSFLNNCS